MSDEDHPPILPEERSVFETDRWIRFMWYLVPGIGLLFVLVNTVLALMGKTHPHFTIDAFPAFYGVVGFLSFSFIVLAGQHLRKILMRDETYYDEADAKHPRIGGDDEVAVRDIDMRENRT